MRIGTLLRTACRSPNVDAHLKMAIAVWLPPAYFVHSVGVWNSNILELSASPATIKDRVGTGIMAAEGRREWGVCPITQTTTVMSFCKHGYKHNVGEVAWIVEHHIER